MPLRRYLRISKYSTLEVRIYVTGGDTSWFSGRMCREAIGLVKPLILPKLREERDAKKKKRPTKDVITGDGFTASVFLQDVQTKHAVLNINKSLTFERKETNPQDDIARESFRESSPLFIPSQDDEDIKDKPTLQTTYDGFTIYGKALWLVVTPTAQAEAANNAREVLLDEWITMSQQQQQQQQQQQ